MIMKDVLMTCYWPVNIDDPQTWSVKGSGDNAVQIYSADHTHSDVYSFPDSFLKSVTMEGCGIVPDLGVIAFSGEYYFLLDSIKYPWGQGALGQAIYPDKSIAVDPQFIKLGSNVFIPELAEMKSLKHNGWVIAADTGGKIKDKHIDLFVSGPKSALEYQRQLGEEGYMRKLTSGIFLPFVTIVLA